MPSRAADRIHQAIQKTTSLSSSARFVVAIDGHSGAGKSTIAAELAQHSGACVVSGDDFYRVMPYAQRLALTAAEGADQFIDWPRLRAEALIPLIEGRKARYQPYDWSNDCLAPHEVTVTSAPLVIVEGVYSARPELADLVSLSVLVEAPAPVRQARIASRGDGPDSWDARWQAAEDVYFSSVRPRHTFDVLVST